MINKLQSIALMAIMLLLAACSKEATDTPQTEEGGWMPSVTRNTTEGGAFNNDIRISGVVDINNCSNTEISGVFSKEGGWKDGGAPGWPTDGKSLYLIATYPPDYSGKKLPVEVKNGGTGSPLMVGYLPSTSKPTGNISFTMKHLMGKLQIHIKVEGDANTVSDVEVMLKDGKINYAKQEIELSDVLDEDLNLGNFKKNTDTGSFECKSFNIIPQTLEKGTQCISFKIGNADYTFTPTADIELKVGKLTHIYLGVAFDEKAILINKGVTVEDWANVTLPEGGTEEETGGTEEQAKISSFTNVNAPDAKANITYINQ